MEKKDYEDVTWSSKYDVRP